MADLSESFDPLDTSDVASSALALAAAASDTASVASVAAAKGSDASSKILAQSAAWEAGGAATFSALTDTPANYTDAKGKIPKVNDAENALEFDLHRQFDNLCRNAAFTSRSGGTSAVPDEYTLEGTPTVAYDTVDTGYGDYAVKLTASGATNEGIKQTLTHLKPSYKYQIFVRAKATGGNSDTARLLTTGATTNIDTETTSTSWTSLTGEFVTDGSGTDVVIKLLAKADGDIIWFCGITCVEGDIPPGNFIRKVNEVIYLNPYISDAGWSSTAKSDGDSGIIDLSAFGNGCPPGIKAVLVFWQIADSGSAAANSGSNYGFVGSVEGQLALGIQISAITNDFLRTVSGWSACDTNGDVYVTVNATGADTLDATIRIYGYLLGD